MNRRCRIYKTNPNGQGEKFRTLIIYMCSCLYSTVQLPGASLASVEVSLNTYKICEGHNIFVKDRYIHRYTAYLGIMKHPPSIQIKIYKKNVISGDPSLFVWTNSFDLIFKFCGSLNINVR